MTPERYDQIGQIYHDALELISNDRIEFINNACGADDELRHEVESLLEAHEEAGDFIDIPPVKMGDIFENKESPTLPEGHVISHYRILSLLAAGGMGQVYLAEDTKLGRKVALKLLPKEFTKDPDRIQRFELEARAASALNHPNILTIHEIGRLKGNYFIATELILGETLRSRMQNGKMPLAEALDVAAQIAGALDVSHRAGVIHRDIKPENVMVREDGIVKVLDFGLTKLINMPESRAQDFHDGAVLSEEMSDQTEGGFVLGTVRYMSPEQTRDSSHVDHRTDLWSLGVVLFEMLSGHPPFQGSSIKERIISIQEKEPPSLFGNFEVVPPAGLEDLVRKALIKNPNDRYQTAKDFLTELRKMIRKLEKEEETSWFSSPARRRGLVIALSALVILAVSTGFLIYSRINQGNTSINAPPSMLKVLPFTSFPGKEADPSFSPDGKMIAFSWNGYDGENFDIYIKSFDATEPIRLTSDLGADRSPSWSPDGRHIAFIRTTDDEDSIILVPAERGAEQVLHSVGRLGRGDALGQSVSWSPDGKSLLYSEKKSLFTPFQIKQLSVENREKQTLTSPPAGSIGDRLPIISPAGDILAFVSRRTNETDDIYLVPISGGEPRRLTSDNLIISGMVWTPDGRDLIYSSNRGGAQHLWKISAAGGTPERLAAGEENPDTLAMSVQGRRLAYSSTTSDMNIWKIEVPDTLGKTVSPPLKLIASTRTDNSPQYSPDGKKIVFTSSRTGSLEIWTCDADGSNSSRVTSIGGAHLGTPRWSPDGRQIVFDSLTENNRDIYSVGVDGNNLRRLTTETSTDTRPSWSRDGRFVYFGSDRSGDWQVWKMPAEGGQAVQVTRNGGREAFESFDGRFVYYAKFDVLGLWRVASDGGEETKVLDQVWQGGWALWEQGVYFVKTEAGHPPSIEFYSFSTGQTKRITTIEKGVVWGGPSFASTADGRSILYVNIDHTESDILLVENF